LVLFIDFKARILPAARDEISLRQSLRVATDGVHRRLHLHSGFAAVQDGSISRGDYSKLLVRLSGFHLAFEAAASIGNTRSRWIAQDLVTMFGADAVPDAAQHSPTMPHLNGAARVFGASYVVEGSALGGLGLARGLDRLLGAGEPNGRRFFEGYGPATGAVWRDFVARLDSVSADPTTRAETIDAAVEVFSVFDSWLAGWETVDVS
jgi:heme oxygenase